MIIDNHVHVGWFLDGYHSSKEMYDATISAEISEFAVSSTSTCAEQYKLVVREMRELQRLCGEKVHPILWLTPRMMKTYGIRYMLHSKVKWKGIKMHWLAHPEWGRNERLLQQGLSIVKQLRVPLLLHSGEQECCQPHLYAPICRELSDTTIVIAHGRPIDQTIELLEEFQNVVVDTAFMPTEHVVNLVEKGFEDRIAFGTDTPIQLVYDSSKSVSVHVKNQIEELVEELPPPIISKILSNNIYK